MVGLARFCSNRPFARSAKQETLMKQPSVYLKMRVLGAVDTVEGRTRHERTHHVAGMTFLDEEGNPRRFTWRTIQTWYYRYKNHGITGMTNRSRKDKGQVRKVTPEELLEALSAAKPHFHNQRTNKRALYRFCIEKGLLHADRIAQTTFYRFIREYDLLVSHDNDNKKRLAFSMKYANQLWQADTMFGPYLDTGGGRKQTKLIAFIDDASRVLCHGQFFFEENVDTLVQAIRAAFYKRGVPEQLLVDNGSIYSCQEITLICARVGCILRHTAVRDAAAKGKIERFFRRVRDQFLVKKLDLSSLEALNCQFTNWVENDYNAVPHDAIGMKPIDRFGIDLTRVRFLTPSEHNDELFYAEAVRKVKKDNTFSFLGRRYETPVDLRDKEIQLRYDRHRQDTAAVVIYHKGQRLGAARLLDAVANGLLRRKELP
jgi:transposase InsO family protein